MGDAAAEMANLLPEPVKLTVGGKEFALEPIRFGQLAKVLRLAAPILSELRAVKGAASIDVLDLMARHGEVLLDVTAVLTGADRAWLAERPLDEAAALVAGLIQVNRDFFENRMGPALANALLPLSGRSSREKRSNGTAEHASPGPTPPSG